jgi:hypothetical protein
MGLLLTLAEAAGDGAPSTDIFNGDFLIATDNGVSLIPGTGWVYPVGSSNWLWENNRATYACINHRNSNTTSLTQEEEHKIIWENDTDYRLDYRLVDQNTPPTGMNFYSGETLQAAMSMVTGDHFILFTTGVDEVAGIKFKADAGERSCYFTNLILTKL